jgi:mannose/fructose/N-acetylgalactosamine-specific phosphotransferase system component IID
MARATSGFSICAFSFAADSADPPFAGSVRQAINRLYFSESMALQVTRIFVLFCFIFIFYFYFYVNYLIYQHSAIFTRTLAERFVKEMTSHSSLLTLCVIQSMNALDAMQLTPASSS